MKRVNIGIKNISVPWKEVIGESRLMKLSLLNYILRTTWYGSLVRKCGGEKAFTQRLVTFFTHKIWDQRYHIGLFQIANEPGFLIPTLYNYVNQQNKTAKIVRYILKNRYKTTRDGIPGNDDSGSMSAWYIFHSLGFYPNAGQDVYLISSPIFKETIIHLENGKALKIVTKKNNDKNIYIQSATLNGNASY